MGILRKLTAVILLVFMLFLFSSCGAGGEEKIYVALDSMPYTLDAQSAESDSELLVCRNIYEGLTRQNEKGETVLAACESYDFSDLTYTFTLKDGLKWSDGSALTADDFVFGIKRALLPQTQAPFARLLYAVKGAAEVNSGNARPNALGVWAEDRKTLKIQLIYDDENFLKTLSMPVAMPCREGFFIESTGKYGLEKDYVLSCGSYRLARWNKPENGIRLYANDEYTGNFKPKNGGVFIAKDKEKNVAEKLISGKADMAILPPEYLTDDILKGNIKTVSVQNICWVLSLGGEFGSNIRQALCMCVTADAYKDELPFGFSVANSIYPEVLGIKDANLSGITYDSVLPRSLISEEIKNFKNKKFPQTTLIYSSCEPMRPVITQIVGNWQKELSTFINIKSTDKSLLGELREHSTPLCVFPVKADSYVCEYLNKFGVDYSGDVLAAQNAALREYNLIPIAFQNTTVGYLENIDGVYMSSFGGYIDFPFVTKR